MADWSEICAEMGMAIVCMPEAQALTHLPAAACSVQEQARQAAVSGPGRWRLEHAGSLLVMGQLVAHKGLLNTGARPPTRFFSNLLAGGCYARYLFQGQQMLLVRCVLFACTAGLCTACGVAVALEVPYVIVYCNLSCAVYFHLSCNYACLASIAVVDPYEKCAYRSQLRQSLPGKPGRALLHTPLALTCSCAATLSCWPHQSPLAHKVLKWRAAWQGSCNTYAACQLCRLLCPLGCMRRPAGLEIEQSS